MRLGNCSLRSALGLVALLTLAGVEARADTPPNQVRSPARPEAKAARPAAEVAQPAAEAPRPGAAGRRPGAEARRPAPARNPVTPGPRLASIPSIAYFTVLPCRVFDSRTPANAPALQVSVERLVQVTGACGIPADAKAVAVNATVDGPTAAGNLNLYPGDGTTPFPNNFPFLEFPAARARANNAVVQLASNGAGTLKALYSAATAGQTVNLILDVNGYFASGAPVAVDDSYSTKVNTPLNQAAPGVLANDTLNGGAIFSYGATTGAEQTTIGSATPTSQGGSVSLNADGSFSYTPPTDFSGDDTFKYVLKNSVGSSTATVTLSVGKTDQTITFTSTAPAGATVGGTPYNVTATASSGLTVTFTIDASATSVCSISGSTVSFIGVGTCVIDANQAGNASYNPAPQVQQSFAVGKGSQTITFTSTAPAGAKVGGTPYTVTATASSGLTVTFTIDASATSVCSISGSTVSFTSVGTCVIDANQAGDANYNAAPQAQQSFPVGKGDQTITFTSTAPANAKVGGTPYTVTATASSGLTVAFTIDASATSVCSISGSTVSFTAAGTCVIDANQAGDANYNAAPQAQQSFAVGKSDQTITFTSTAPAGAKVGGTPYTVTATASSGLTVTFTIDASATSVCSISGSTVSFTAVGTCVIDANQAGNANYNAAPQVQQSFAVAKGDQTITFTSTAPAGAKVGGTPYTVTATASSGLTVTFTIDASATSVCSISGSTVSFTSVGTCVIDANQAGNANYNAAPQAQQSFSVAKGDQTITFTSTAPAGAKVGGTPYTVTATASSGLTPVTFTIDASAASVCSISGSTVSFIGAGTCVIDANQAGNANYNAAPQAQQSFSVAKGDQTITFTSTAPPGAKVGGPTYTVMATASSGLTVTFTIDAVAASVCSISGSTVSFTAGGTCVIDANQAGNANYNAAPQVQQSFPVAKADQTINFTSTPPTTAKIGDTYTVSATATSGLAVTITIDASATSVCSISGSLVTFNAGGSCVIDANQAGNASYNPAPQVQQSVYVNMPPQPIASPKENFDTVGNTQLEFKAAKALPVSIFVMGNLVANFTDSDGPNPLSAVPISGGATTNGGTVDVATNGEFTFTPKAGDTAASDSFQYQVTDGLYTVTRTVTVNLKSRAWYVNNTAPAGGTGRSHQPFNTLAAAQTASLAGDYIFVYGGDLTTTGQASGITLKDSQKLYGEAFGLTITNTLNGVANPTLVAANAANRPLIDDTTATSDGVTALNIGSVEVRGLSIGATRHAISVSTTGSSSGGATITNNVIRLPGNDGIHAAAGGSGTMTLAVQSNSITGNTNGINIQKTAGTLYITGFNDNTVSGSTPGSGIVVSGAIFDAVPGGAIQTVAGGTTNIGVSGDGVGASGMLLSGVVGDLSFTNFGIYNSSGTGLMVSSTGALNAGAATGFRVVVGAGVATINSNGGPAVDVSNASVTLPLNSLTSTNSSTTGVSLVNAFGGVGNTALSFSSGSISDPAGASGTAVNVNGGTGNVTIGVPITNTSGNSVVVTNRTSDTVSFSSTINDTGSGISLTSNTGATISFTGALTLSTGANAGFTATGGGTVTASDTTSTVTTTTGTAVNVANTTIGAAGLKWKSVSAGTAASGPANGIVLNTTGSSGGLTVSGTGSAGTGGTIQKTTSHGISLTSTKGVSLSWMNVSNSGADGIMGSSVNGFTLDHAAISDSSGSSTTDDGVNLSNSTGGVSITSSSITGSPHQGITIDNNNTNMSSFTLTGTTVSGSTGGDGVLMTIRGTSVLTTGTISGCTFSSNFSTGLQVSNADTGNVQGLTIQNNTVSGNNAGMDLDLSQGSSMTVNVLTNTFNNHKAASLNVFTASTATSGTFTAKLQGNVIGTVGTKDSGSATGAGIRVITQNGKTGDYTIDGNTVNEVPNSFGLDIESIGHTSGASVKAKITNNTVTRPTGTNTNIGCGSLAPCPESSIFVSSDTDSASESVCLVLTGNTAYDPTSWPQGAGFAAYYLARRGPTPQVLNLEGNTSQSPRTNVLGDNTVTNFTSGDFIDESGNVTVVAVGTCGSFP
jgi:Bacterial Ig domain/Cadherin-like domain